MHYPPQHRQIVGELLAGKFILEASPLFAVLQAHKPFYHTFFEASHGYELSMEGNYYFLTSKESQEATSRDFILFLCLLAYEMHNAQRDVVKELLESTFSVAEVEALLRQSSKYDDLIKGTQAEDLPRFLHRWHQRHLLTFADPQRHTFTFNAPLQTFLNIALTLSETHLQG